MVREDWVSVGIPRGVINELDLFLKTEDAKKVGVMNRQQIITLLLRKFLDEGIESLSKSDDKQDSIRKQLEIEFDKKFEELEKGIPKMMMKMMPMFKENATKKERLEGFSFLAEGDPQDLEVINEEIEKIKKEKEQKK